jgi:hypothetical protein
VNVEVSNVIDDCVVNAAQKNEILNGIALFGRLGREKAWTIGTLGVNMTHLAHDCSTLGINDRR